MSFVEDAKTSCVEDIKAADRQAALVLSEIASTRRPLGSAIDTLDQAFDKLQRARAPLDRALRELERARVPLDRASRELERARQPLDRAFESLHGSRRQW